MVKFIKLIVSLTISFLAGAIGSWATFPNISTWYDYLQKPWFTPPNWIFGPVWTFLYICTGVALYLVWTKSTKANKSRAYWWFGAQLTLNTLWSLVFFGLHAPWLAIVVILSLLVAVIATIYEFGKFSRVAAAILFPYVGWIIFASMLNISVAFLNWLTF